MPKAAKFLGAAVCTALVTAMAFLAAPNPADAEAAADVVRGNGCIFFDANGTAFVDPDARVQIVATNNRRGNANVYCQGSLPAGATLPSRAMHFDFDNTGFSCLAGDDWKMTVTPSGRASFTCHVPI